MCYKKLKYGSLVDIIDECLIGRLSVNKALKIANKFFNQKIAEQVELEISRRKEETE